MSGQAHAAALHAAMNVCGSGHAAPSTPARSALAQRQAAERAALHRRHLAERAALDAELRAETEPPAGS